MTSSPFSPSSDTPRPGPRQGKKEGAGSAGETTLLRKATLYLIVRSSGAPCGESWGSRPTAPPGNYYLAESEKAQLERLFERYGLTEPEETIVRGTPELLEEDGGVAPA
jgi:hypothetical protein